MSRTDAPRDALGLLRPMAGHPPMVVDQAASVTAKVNVVQAAARDEPIPLGWAMDPDDNPTPDAKRGRAGSMAADGGGFAF